MTHHTFDYTALMREHGFRVTPQRQLILDVICESRGHMTPEEIYKHVHAQAPAVNRATIYRNLDFLCDMRLVVAAQIGGQMHYEIAGEVPHHHLICRKCNKIMQISHDVVKGLFDEIQREKKFVIDMDHVTLFGLCQKCQRAELRSVARPKSRK